jgi:glucose-1-phosphate thymidylyltransferase
MNGVILAGGYGTRLLPLTKVMNKHLLPVYNKPMIYYSLSTLILAGATHILIISSDEHLKSFQNLLGDGTEFKIKIDYAVQDKPVGIPDGLLLANKFFGKSSIILILGDNIFHGVGLGKHLRRFKEKDGCSILGFRVADPSNYGIIELDDKMEVSKIMEKPVKSNSNIAITGLYFFDDKYANYASLLTPSKRGETEIVDLLNHYSNERLLNFEMLPRGTAWFDTGTIDGVHEASTYIKVVEKRTGLSIGDPYEIVNQIWAEID